MPETLSTTKPKVRHVSLRARTPYDRFTAKLEALLGRFDPAVLESAAGGPDSAMKQVKQMEGEQGLMIFQMLDHGAALQWVGQRRKAIAAAEKSP
jgi:hypothetical protein